MTNPTPEGPLAPVYRLEDFRTDDPPQSPLDTAEVWAEVMAAARLFGTLREAGMSVRFETDGEGPPRVHITDLEGNEIGEIPPSIACDAAALEAEAFKLNG